MFRMASAILRYVKEHYKLPSTFKYGNVTYYQHEIVYIVSWGVNHLTSSVINIPDYAKQYTSEGDNLNLKINKVDYIEMSLRVYNYIKSNKKLPAYVKYGTKKVNIDIYTLGMCKVLDYYKNYKELPNRAAFNHGDFVAPKPVKIFKKYGRSTKTGCDNMGQNNGYYCGVHSLQEVFRNLTGIVVSQSTIAGWAGTTTSGTGHSGLDTAVAMFNKKYNQNLKVSWKNFSDLGWTGIKNIINSNNQDCIIHNLYRNQYGHYEVVNNVSGNITVQNSLGSKCSQGCYCGYIEYRTQTTFRSYINGISQKSVMVITNA